MNKSIKTLVLAAVIIMFGASFASKKVAPHIPVKQVSFNVFSDYVWYKDAEMTDPTGTYCELGEEISRLQNLFGGYIFSASPQTNLHQYEWGYNPILMTAIIYSDR